MKSSNRKPISHAFGSGKRCSTFFAVLVLLSAVAVRSQADTGVIVHTAKPYDTVVAGIEALGGTVTYQYQNVDGLAARIPLDKLGDPQAMGEVVVVERDDLLALDPPRADEPQGVPLDMTGRELLSVAELAEGGIEPTNYYSYLSSATGAVDTWAATGAGAGSIVAVIDTGTQATHVCLAGRVIEGPDFSSDAGGPFGGSTRYTNHYHGTFVAGQAASNCGFLILAGDAFDTHLPPEAKIPFPPIPGTFVVSLLGIAPLAEIYALKAYSHTGDGLDSGINAAIDHVITTKLSGALDIDVLNMSLGGASLNDGHTLMERLVDAATDAGITVVIAAANTGPSPGTVARPGTAYSAVTVGAAIDPVHTRIFWDLVRGAGAGMTLYPADELRIRAASAQGPYADGRKGPDLVATGRMNLGPVTSPSGGDLAFGSGSSYSAPQVAGAAALLHAWAEHNDPSLNARHVRNALIDGAAPMAAVPGGCFAIPWHSRS